MSDHTPGATDLSTRLRANIGEWSNIITGLLMFLPPAAFILGGLASIGKQLVDWLKTAEWKSFTLRQGLEVSYGLPVGYKPQTGYLGFDQILLWCLDQTHVALWLIFAAPMAWVATSLLFIKIADVENQTIPPSLGELARSAAVLAGLGALTIIVFGPTVRETRNGNSHDLEALVARQLHSCWQAPAKDGPLGTTIVTVKWSLQPNGFLDGEPTLENPTPSPEYGQAAELALAAVKSCAPFKLPPGSYQKWRTIIWDFDAREFE